MVYKKTSIFQTLYDQPLFKADQRNRTGVLADNDTLTNKILATEQW